MGKNSKPVTVKTNVQFLYGGRSEDGDQMTLLVDSLGRQLGYLFNDTAKKLGLPTVGYKKKRVLAVVEVTEVK